MTFVNQSPSDRTIRAIAGIVLLATALMVSSPVAGIALTALATIALGTAAAGWCPAYSLLGRSTLKRTAGHCPNCEPHGTS